MSKIVEIFILLLFFGIAEVGAAQPRAEPLLDDLQEIGHERWGLQCQGWVDEHFHRNCVLSRISPTSGAIEKFDFSGEDIILNGSEDGGIAALATDLDRQSSPKLYWHALGSLQFLRADKLLPKERYLGVATVGSSIWVISQSKLFHIIRAKSERLQIKHVIRFNPASLLKRQRGHAMHYLMLDDKLLYFGFANGEWGGGLYRVDIRNGNVSEVRNNFHDKDELSEIPVTDIIRSPWNKQCLYVSLSLAHLSGRTGRVVLVCEGKKPETVFARIAPDGKSSFPGGDKTPETVLYDLASEPISRLWNNQGKVEINTWYGTYQLSDPRTVVILERHKEKQD